MGPTTRASTTRVIATRVVLTMVRDHTARATTVLSRMATRTSTAVIRDLMAATRARAHGAADPDMAPMKVLPMVRAVLTDVVALLMDRDLMAATRARAHGAAIVMKTAMRMKALQILLKAIIPFE